MTLGGVALELHLHPEVIALCLGLLVGYWALIRRFGPVMVPQPGERAVSRRQVAAFAGGVLAIWIASGSPIHDLAERYLYSAHMVQHLLQAYIAPPLLLLGMPQWMGEVLLAHPRVRTTVRLLSRPALAGVAFNIVLALIHWPAVVDLMLVSEPAHAISHFALVTTATLMWLNLVSPVPAIIPRLDPLPRMLYLFLMTILPTVPASFLTLGHEPLYGAYAAFPRLWGLSALDDMRIAGLIMKTGGGFLLWGIIAVMFFRWAADEERRDRPEAGSPPLAPRPTDVPTI